MLDKFARTDFFQSIAARVAARRPRVARDRSGTGKPLHLSLRAKGILVLVLLVIYGAIVGLFVGHERAKLLYIVQEVDRIHADTELLVKINSGVMHSIVALQAVIASDDYVSARGGILLDTETFRPYLADLGRHFPATAAKTAFFEQRLNRASTEWTLPNLTALRDAEQELAAQVERLEEAAEAQNTELLDFYRESNSKITVVVSALNFTGLVLFGAAVIIFLTRLASDVKKVEARAAAIVSGYRGEPLDVQRDDEVGGLMRAINGVQSELSVRERREEMTRQQRFHQDKMAAVGSLAAAVAHEVSNPINSISGIAQHTIEMIRSQRHPNEETLRRNAELTLKQTERIAAIVRHLADMRAPHSPDPELLDLNELVSSTCGFVRYDKRLRQIDLVVDADPHVPPVRAVADHLTQVLMNLLINSADAMQGTAAGKPTIRVSTRKANGEIALCVSDNGHGMDPWVLAHAFDEFFTTKPASTGRGIGLYLCKTLLAQMGGAIDLQSTPGAGTVATVRLPARIRQA